MVDGKRVSRLFATQAEAESFRMELAHGTSIGATVANESFGHVVKAWLTHVEQTKDPRTFDTYSWAVGPFEQLYSVPAHNIRTLHLQTVVDGQTGRKAQMGHDKIKQCLKWAKRMGMVHTDASAEMERPKHVAKPIEVFDLDEVAAILDAAEHLREAAAIRLALSVGLRFGEMLALQWGDWSGHELSIQRQASDRNGHLTIKAPKRESVRTIPLSDSVVEALEQRNRDRMAEGLAGSEWIFPTRRGGIQYRANFAHKTWRPLIRAAGLKPRGFHHCRHTAASLMLNNGVPITTVARILGHRDPATTLSTYAHLMTSDLEQHRNCFDAVIPAKTGS